MGIPSDEDFARAERHVRERHRGLHVVVRNVHDRFATRCPLRKFAIFPSRKPHSFHAYVFYERDRDIEACAANGTTDEIIAFAHAELERVGRGKMDETEITFEVDSHENVLANFDGDYLYRMT